MRKDVADAWTIGANPHGKHAVWPALEGSAISELDRESSVNLGGTRFAMIKKSSVLLMSLIGIVLATVAFGRPPTKPHKMATVSPRTRYLPEYTASGELMLPKNNIWREWVFVGEPLTPNALNGGKAGFPEYHNVYIEPGSYEIFKEDGRVSRWDDHVQGAAAYTDRRESGWIED
jgi:hypothetical protein